MIERDLLLKSFEAESLPGWPCPRCTTGVLLVNRATKAGKPTEPEFVWGYDAPSHAENISRGDPFSTGPFAALLKCSNKECLETVAISGTFGLDQNDEEACRRGGPSYLMYCTPKMFIPALRIFPLPANCPKEIKDEVVAAFGLFWYDTAACANRLRTAIEEFLTVLHIPRCPRHKTTKKLLRGKRLKAHERIELLAKTQPDLAEWLMALKWLGNEGSHGGKLTKENILEGFELMEHVFREHFEQHMDRLTRLRKKLINRRGKAGK